MLDLGGVQELLLQWQRLEREQKLMAPRIFTVGPLFTAPGGHPAGTLYLDNRFISENVTCQVDTVEAAQTKVHNLILDHQVDAIKVVYDDIQGQKPKLPLAVLRAIIEMAHQHDRQVFVHVGTAQDVLDAVQAGCDGIEHMVNVDDPHFAVALEQAARKRVVWTPTLTVYEAFAERWHLEDVDDHEVAGSVSAAVLASLKISRQRWCSENDAVLEQLRQRSEAKSAGVRQARKAEVQLVLGTDAGNPAVFHGLSVHRELELLVKAGYSEMEAIHVATKAAAEKLGVGKVLGTLEVGKDADLVVLAANPLDDIRNARKVEWVIKRGVAFPRGKLAVKADKLSRVQPEEACNQPVRRKTAKSVRAVAEMELDQAQGLVEHGRRLQYNAAHSDDFYRAKTAFDRAEGAFAALTEQTPNSASTLCGLA